MNTIDFNETVRPIRFYIFSTIAFIAVFFLSQNYLSWPIFLGSIYGAYKAFKEGSVNFLNLNINEWHLYHFNNYEKLINEYEFIVSFEMVSSWDEEAEKEMQSQRAYNEKLSLYIKECDLALEEYINETKNLSFWKNLTRYRAKERYFKEYIKILSNYYIFDSLDDLQRKIDFSPKNKDEQKYLIAQLKNLIDDHKDKKRELISDSKDIKDLARLKQAEINNSFFSSPSSRRHDRQRTKEWKDSKIARIENQKYEVSQKIRAIEKQIAWIKKIKDTPKGVRAS